MPNRSSSYYQYLVSRYFDNTISRDELDELMAMVRSGAYEEATTEVLLEQWQAAQQETRPTSIDWDGRLDALLQEHPAQAAVIPVQRYKLWPRIAVAGVLLLSLGAGIYYMGRPAQQRNNMQVVEAVMSADTAALQPGTNGAVLVLANGDKIVLDSAGNGLLTMQGATKVLNHNGALRYDGNNNAQQIVYNTLTTPRGRQFQLQLSDGTKVWLNAGSSIRFPTAFEDESRRVEMTGEAYFEVAHINRKPQQSSNTPVPFIVSFTTPAGHTGEVQVLGTHFNINAYDDEQTVKTTLLEGKVNVTVNGQTALLSPGQQAAVQAKGSIKTLDQVDLDAVVAWKNGYFSFSQTDLATLMRQIARWYDVDIEYAGTVPDRKFGGEISRNSNAQQVLKIMEESAVRFRIDGRKIIVLP